MEKDRLQLFLTFTGEEAQQIIEAAKRYKRKPSQLGKIIVLDWLRAVQRAEFPPLIDFVPRDTFVHGQEDKGEVLRLT